MVMALICSWMAHWVGRKHTLMALLLLGTVGFVLPVLSMGKTSILGMARLLQGMGIISMAHAIYVAETSDPRMRGLVLGLANVAVNVGIVQVYMLSAFLEWRTLSAILSLFPFTTLLIFASMAPESPAWLHLQGRTEEAERARHCLGLQAPSEKTHEDEHRSLCSKLANPAVFKPILVLMGVMASMMLSGGFAFSFFALQFLQKIDPSIHPSIPAIIMTTLRLVGSILGVIVVRYFDRRSTLMLSSLVMAVAMLSMSLTLLFESSLASLFPSFSFILQSHFLLLLTALYTLAFSVGLGVVPFVLLGELALPQNASLTAGLGVSFGYLVLFVVLQSYPYLVSFAGLWFICLLFAITCLLTVPYVYFLLPETRNKTLEDVARCFEGSKKKTQSEEQRVRGSE